MAEHYHRLKSKARIHAKQLRKRGLSVTFTQVHNGWIVYSYRNSNKNN